MLTSVPVPRRALPALLALALLACRGDASEVDCATAGDFTPCPADVTADGAVAMCLDGTCAVVPACPDESCAQAQYTPVPDTSLRACYGPSDKGQEAEIPCPTQVGTPACADTSRCGQDAQYGWDARNPASARFEVQDADGEPVVSDTVTGLTWQGCAVGQGQGCAGEAFRGSWHEASAACDELVWGGHDDWILPDVYALQSITDFSTTSPAIDTSVFRNAPHLHPEDSESWWKECTWSSTPRADDDTIAWATMVNSGDVLLGSGIPYHPHDKAAEGWEGCYARCMRAPARPEHARWVQAGTSDEIVWIDTLGQRSWAACSIGQSGSGCSGQASQLPWVDALAACEGLSWGGHDDWRLPNVLELRSLVDVRARQPAIDVERFPNTPTYDGQDDLRGQYWSSTARWYNSFALYVSVLDGGSHFYVQSEGRHVRCVRGDLPAPPSASE